MPLGPPCRILTTRYGHITGLPMPNFFLRVFSLSRPTSCARSRCQTGLDVLCPIQYTPFRRVALICGEPVIHANGGNPVIFTNPTDLRFAQELRVRGIQKNKVRFRPHVTCLNERNHDISQGFCRQLRSIASRETLLNHEMPGVSQRQAEQNASSSATFSSNFSGGAP